MKEQWGGSGKFISKDIPSWTRIGRWSVGVEGREEFRINSYVKGGYCKVGRRMVSVGGKASSGSEPPVCIITFNFFIITFDSARNFKL